MKNARIKVGTKFRYHYADSNPEWEVIGARGRGTWDCQIVATELDYAGTQKCYSSEEINGALQMADFWENTANESVGFYANLREGTIVHYKNGFGQFVRCRVTKTKELLPFELVGNWREFDLPKRQADGSVYLGYHAEKIQQKKTFRPHASNIWEFNHGNQPDPTTLPAINLDVPAMTPVHEQMAFKIQHLKAMRKILDEGDEYPDETVKKLQDVIASYYI
jgi:hypothetical protein